MNQINPTRTSLRLSLLSIAILTSFSSMADDIERDPLLKIQEVIVVKGQSVSAVEASMTHWSISRDDIEASGAQSLDKVLKNVPGIYVRVGGQGTPRVDIRGFKARHVIYLINGVPANDAEDGQFDPSVIPTSLIESIEVSVGPSSVLYGPGGAGGVINIITREGDMEPSSSGNLEFSENDTANGNINVAGSGSNWQGFMSYNHQQTDGFPMSSDYDDTEEQMGDTRLNADKTLDNVYAQGSYFVSNDTMITGNINYNSASWGKPSSDGTGSSKVKYERIDDFDSMVVQLGIAHKFSQSLVFRGFGYHNESDTVDVVYKSSDYDDIKSSQDSTSTVQGANLQLIKDMFDYGMLTTSLISEQQRWESTSATSGSDSSDQFDKEAWLHTFAAEYQYQSDDLYGMTLGLAAHNHEQDKGNDDNYSGQLSGYWSVSDNSKLHAGIARKVRFPSLTNLYSQSSGNEDLTPEESAHIELGFKQGLAYQTEFDVTGFYTEADDYIAKDDDSIYQNLGDYKFKGIDFSVKNQYFDNLMLTVSYSYLDSEALDDDNISELEYRPKNQYRFQGQYQFGVGLKVSLDIEHITDQIFYTSEKISGNTVSVQNELDSYTLIDLNLSQPIFGDNLEAYIRATNLLDENYYQSEALPQAGRQVFVGINWQL